MKTNCLGIISAFQHRNCKFLCFEVKIDLKIIVFSFIEFVPYSSYKLKYLKEIKEFFIFNSVLKNSKMHISNGVPIRSLHF